MEANYPSHLTEDVVRGARFAHPVDPGRVVVLVLANTSRPVGVPPVELVHRDLQQQQHSISVRLSHTQARPVQQLLTRNADNANV